MSTRLQDAQAELTADLRREINWFVPPGERHFVDAGTVSAAATVLLGLFFAGLLDGLKETVKEGGKKAGQSLGKWAVERLRAMVSDKEEADQAQVERDAEAARAAIGGGDQVRADLVFGQVEAELRAALEEVMPEPRAAKLAMRVRHVAVKVVYEVEGAS